MKKNELKINYYTFSSLEELDKADRVLIEKAIEATKTAYAPYSDFYVGAAIRLANGEIIIGSNQENSAYTSGLCAERVALFQAGVLYPNTAIESMAITARAKGKTLNAVANPCGSCRQVMNESALRQNKPFRVILVSEKNNGFVFESNEDFLPFSFKFE